METSINDQSIQRQGRNTSKLGFCQVCGDKARIINYGALSCQSCKTFFRRNGFHSKNLRRCLFNEQCPMTIETRRNCSSCRLTKCFSVGMNSELIRKEEQKSSSNPNPKRSRQRQRQQSNLIDQRIHLSPKDWTFLSEMIRNFQQMSLTQNVRRTIEDLSLFTSTKIDFDMANALEMLDSMFSSILSFLRSSKHFRFFNSNVQWILIEQYLIFIVDFFSLQLYRDFHLFQNENFFESFSNIFGSTMFNYFQRLSDRLDSDSNLLIIFYFVLIFSSEFLIGFRSTTNSNEISTIDQRNLLRVQNHYVEFLWKYSIHRYGFVDSTRKYLRLLDLFHQLTKYSTWNYTNNTIYHDLVDQSLENLKHSFVFNSSNIEQL